jgi:hypothetical protein
MSLAGLPMEGDNPIPFHGRTYLSEISHGIGTVGHRVYYAIVAGFFSSIETVLFLTLCFYFFLKKRLIFLQRLKQ